MQSRTSEGENPWHSWQNALIAFDFARVLAKTSCHNRPHAGWLCCISWTLACWLSVSVCMTPSHSQLFLFNLFLFIVLHLFTYHNTKENIG